jgi:ABC-2 type transport system permease protein/capsular polysaccharide transport system permease protein
MNYPVSDVQNSIGERAPQLALIEAREAEVAQAASPGRKRDLWLLMVLAAITLAAALYNFVIATPRYVSDMSYVLRTPAGSQERLTFLNFGGGGTGADDSHAIVSFIESRDLVETVNKDGKLAAVFADPAVDIFSAFPSVLAGSGRDEFYRHAQKYLRAEYDTETAITNVAVEAFRAEDANALAQRIKAASESKVNDLNRRARGALVETAQSEVDAISAQLTTLHRGLTDAQQRYGIIDPKLEAGAAIGLSAATARELDRINIELATTIRAAPDSPKVDELRNRRKSLEAGLRAQRQRTAGGDASLAQRLEPYLTLAVQRDVAEQHLLAATLALATARNSSTQEHIYIEWIAQPSMPDEPLRPRAWWNVFLTFLIAAGSLWIVRSLSDLVLADD